MINICVNDNYLKLRECYATLFCILRDDKLSLNDFNKIMIDYKDKDKNTLLNGLSNITKFLSLDLNHYFEIMKDEIIPLEKLSLLNNQRLSFILFNDLSSRYKDIMDKTNHRTILSEVMTCSPLDLTPIISKNKIPFNYMILLIDFIYFSIRKDSFKEFIFDFINKGSTLLECYSKPFSFLQKNDDSLAWIVNRMINEKIWNIQDINVTLKNERWNAVLSCFDYWAISATSSSIKLFLLQSRKAWSQKKFRKSVKDKVVLNTYISKEAKKKLKELAKKNKININEVLERLILNYNNLQEATEADSNIIAAQEFLASLE